MKLILAFAMVVLVSGAADAKCIKGKRVMDGVRYYECVKMKGVWRDAREWPRQRSLRAREKQ